jgi:hypothetical protein
VRGGVRFDLLAVVPVAVREVPHRILRQPADELRGELAPGERGSDSLVHGRALALARATLHGVTKLYDAATGPAIPQKKAGGASLTMGTVRGLAPEELDARSAARQKERRAAGISGVSGPGPCQKLPPGRSRAAAAGAPGRGGVATKREHAAAVVQVRAESTL